MPADDPTAADRLAGIVDFLQAAAQLKDTLRSARTAKGRAESTAEHSWRLCLMVMMFERDLPGYDISRLLKLCLVHDLGEAIHGDTPAVEQRCDPDRAGRERADLITLCAPLPADLQRSMLALWDEYATEASPEAVLAKRFDKLETMLQHAIGRNDPGFDYAFNLTYGAAQTRRHPLLTALRALVDARTRDRIARPGSAFPERPDA
jgi:putative hydrolase of HD superfamily